MSGGGAEAWNAPIQAMSGEARPGYPGDKGGVCRGGGGGSRRGKNIWRRRERERDMERRVGADDRDGMIQ